MPVTCVGYSSSSTSTPSPAFSGEFDLPSRFLDIEQIGQGATCVVLKARDAFLDRPVAIKFMRSELTDYNSVRRFQQEAKMMSSFNLKHLPLVLDFGLSPSGRPYMVMELVSGMSLKQTIAKKNGRLTVELVIAITIQLLSALQHAHERGIVHRDLKSQNIMVTWHEDGTPLIKIVDFGLAGEINRPGTITECGAALGTPYYMSPEQAQGCSADARSDLYSLGCVMFEMLTGRPPFQKGSATETINAHVRETAPMLKSKLSIDSDVLVELERMVAKLLEKKPARRYQCAKDLKTEMEGLIEKKNMHTADESHRLVDQQIESPLAGFSSWTNVRSIQIMKGANNDSAWTEGANSWSSKKNSLSQNIETDAGTGNSSSQLSESFSAIAASRRPPYFAMILLAMALALLCATTLISLEPAFLPVSAARASAPPALETLNPVTKLEREETAQLSDNPSDQTRKTFKATVGGKFHVSDAELWALPSLSDSDLKMIKDFPTVRNLNLITSQSVTGKGFHDIKTLPIESLDLRSLTIAQTGFDAIGEMPALRTLNIDYMPFLTVSKISSLRSARSLKTLTCQGTHLSARCQSEIAKLPHLSGLFIANASGLNDSSLEIFAKMQELKWLSIGSTGSSSNISEAAIERFKKVRPDVNLEIRV